MTEPEINLNAGLNPQIPAEYKPLPVIKEIPKVDILEEKVKDWNNNPKIKEAGYKADKVWKWEFWKIMGILGILSFLIIACSIGYSVWKDGSIVPKFVMNCPASTLTCPNINFSCPASVSCPSCVCPDITCPSMPSTLNLYCRNSS